MVWSIGHPSGTSAAHERPPTKPPVRVTVLYGVHRRSPCLPATGTYPLITYPLPIRYLWTAFNRLSDISTTVPSRISSSITSRRPPLLYGLDWNRSLPRHQRPPIISPRNPASFFGHGYGAHGTRLPAIFSRWHLRFVGNDVPFEHNRTVSRNDASVADRCTGIYMRADDWQRVIAETVKLLSAVSVPSHAAASNSCLI